MSICQMVQICAIRRLRVKQPMKQKMNVSSYMKKPSGLSIYDYCVQGNITCLVPHCHLCLWHSSQYWQQTHDVSLSESVYSVSLRHSHMRYSLPYSGMCSFRTMHCSLSSLPCSLKMIAPKISAERHKLLKLPTLIS